MQKTEKKTKLLSIETSCDESALSVVLASGGFKKPKFSIVSNHVASQVDLHATYGGVFPMMAKREHAKNLPLLLEEVLKDARTKKAEKSHVSEKIKKTVLKLLEREGDMAKQVLLIVEKYERPDFDLIAVTQGPGLEPALWVGLNFAKALSILWNIPLIPINHMEGHVLSIFMQESKGVESLKLKVESKTQKKNRQKMIHHIYEVPKIQFPALALLISGGHTELVLVKSWMNYTKIGRTKDDAVGEAFDKVARMMNLPYPGGPHISALAQKCASQKSKVKSYKVKLPRPMLHSGDYDFSFSGLKTAVLYLIRDLEKNHTDILQNDGMKEAIAKEFQDAVIEVLVTKTIRAASEYKIKTIIVGGGVAANTHIRKALAEGSQKIGTPIYFPSKDLSTDNSLMIAIAGYFRSQKKTNKKSTRKSLDALAAKGNLSL